MDRRTNPEIVFESNRIILVRRDYMRVALGQINPLVGDMEGNVEKIIKAVNAMGKEIDLAVFPEMCLTGYPPRDLLEIPELHNAVEKGLERLMGITAMRPEMGLIVGGPMKTGRVSGAGLYNAAILLQGGKSIAARAKTLLPSYDVFDETRYFDPGRENTPVFFKGRKLGLTVCEDALSGPPGLSARTYSRNPVYELIEKGADLIINISASPFHLGKEELRFKRLSELAATASSPVIYVNQVGGNDELVFDGGGVVFNSEGKPLGVGKFFETQLLEVDLDGDPVEGGLIKADPMASLHGALTLGIRDYLHKCGFGKAVLGMSGGIDSAVTCCLAVDALGQENVCGVAMPSRFSSPLSCELARKQAETLGIRFEIIPIDDLYKVFLKSLCKPLELGPETGDVDITLENIQARIRGALLMAFSNRQGYMLLATGNKSEMSVGYSTLYGDMSGGLSVLADVPKTMVYRLAGFLNSEKEVIPQGVIDRPPSAELRPDQKDSDTLPPYPVVDAVLKMYIEDGVNSNAIVESGYNRTQVEWIIKAIHCSEYKRRQAPPGIRVTTKAFGAGRRFPLAARVP